MKIKEILRKQNCDLIEGPVKTPEIEQVWLKKDLKPIELAKQNIRDIYSSTIKQMPIQESVVLDINGSQKDILEFKSGITLLKNLLKKLEIPLDKLAYKNSSKSINSIEISFSDAIKREIPIFDIANYFSNGKLTTNISMVVENANKDNLIFISGLILVKKLEITFNYESKVTNEITAEIKDALNINWELTNFQESSITMVYNSPEYVQMAVQAHRLIFKKGKFDKIRLVTNNLLSMFK